MQPARAIERNEAHLNALKEKAQQQKQNQEILGILKVGALGCAVILLPMIESPNSSYFARAFSAIPHSKVIGSLVLIAFMIGTGALLTYMLHRNKEINRKCINLSS